MRTRRTLTPSDDEHLKFTSLQLNDWIKSTSHTRIAGPKLPFDLGMRLMAFDNVSSSLSRR